MAWPRLLRRAVRNWDAHAVEQASRRWRGSRISDPCGLDADNAVLDDMRRWILGDLAAEARCAPEAKATTLKVHTGSIADHVSNWGDVCDTLRGTRYEKYLDD